MKDPVLIFDWEEAPEELKVHSHCGGDEDFIVVVPKDISFWLRDRLYNRLDDGDGIWEDCIFQGKRVQVLVVGHC